MKLLRKHGESFFDLSIDMFCIADTEGYFLDLTDNWSKILGWSTEELLARPYMEFIHPDDIQPTIEVASALNEGVEVVHFRNRYKTKQGSYKWLSWRATLQEKEGLVIAVATDVTTQMEDQVLVSKGQQVARIGSWKVDVAAGLCHWSEMTYQIHEVKPGTTIALQDGINYYVPHHRALIEKCVQEAIEKNKDWDVEAQILTANNKRIWVRAIGWPIIEEGKLLRLEGVFQDINEHKIGEEKLRENNEALRSYETALNMHSIVAKTDLRGIITYVNDKFCEISGYTSEELVGNTHALINSGHHPQSFFRDMWLTISTGKIWRGEVRNRAKDGSLYWVDTSITPILGPNGRPVEFIAIRNDITDRKAFERRLAEEQEKTLAAHRAKSQFLASMSHEIRTPMNGVIGMTDMLLQEIDNEAHREKLKIIRDCGDHLITLINDILDYSKVEAGKMQLEEETFPIAEFLDSTIQLFSPIAEEKGIGLNYDTKGLIDKVHMDKRKLGQILFNLIGNAIKFTEKGAVQVRARIDGKTTLVVEVADTGPGIPDELKANLFTAFTQGRNQTAMKGTGLGLAISRELSQLMKGELGFTSQSGKGTTFTVSLPFERAHKSSANCSQKKISSRHRDTDFRGLRILVAEDNKVNRMVAGGMLKKLGVTATFATNGQETVDFCKEQTFDIVLMDVHMPNMDGLQATRILRSQGFDDLVIIALAAGVFEDDHQACLDAGMDFFLAKPLKLDSLRDALSQFKAGRIDHAS